MKKGVLLFAQNNKQIDYIKQAAFCANRIKHYMKLPVAIATNDVSYAKDIASESFVSFINIDTPVYNQFKQFYNGVYSSTSLPWYNKSRSNCYKITPFDETIVMDTDFIVSNDILNNAFSINKDVMLYKTICDVGNNRNLTEFNYITDTSIPMFWATVFYFKKSPFSKMFFDLVSHVEEEWDFYRLQYQIVNKNFRNDFAFSIASHILNGFTKSTLIGDLPGNFWFTSDRDILLDINSGKIKVLIDQTDSGNYIPATVENCNVHIMNKFTLQDIINNV